jgi:hypothetical protein
MPLVAVVGLPDVYRESLFGLFVIMASQLLAGCNDKMIGKKLWVVGAIVNLALFHRHR